MSATSWLVRRLVRKTSLVLAASVILILTCLATLTGCIDQHADQVKTDTVGTAYEIEPDARLVATSPAVAQICNRLNLDLVGVCETSGTLPDRYKNLTKVGMAMNPDLEIIKSLEPDHVLSPSSLQNDLGPKYEGANLDCLFLDLKSVEGMYNSIEELGARFDRTEEANSLMEEFNTFMETYSKQNEGKGSPKVLVLMGLPGSYIVATDNSYVGSLVKLAGGTNVYGDGDGQEFLNANTEDMKTKEPDVILRAAHALPDKVKAMFAEEFETNDIWKHFVAVQEGRVYDLDPALFNMSANFSYVEALEALQPMLYNE